MALRRSQKLADPQHHVAGIVPPLALAPKVQLLGKIACRLSGQRRIGCAQSLPLLAVAARTGSEPALGVAFVIKPRPFLELRPASVVRQAGIVKAHRLALARIQLMRDPAHLRLIPTTIRIGLKLPLQVAGIKAGQPRRPRAIATPVQPMAGEAGIARSRPSSAQRDHPSVLGETIERGRVGVGTAHQGKVRDERKSAHPVATVRLRRWFPAAVFALAACKPPPEQRQAMPIADPAHGIALIKQVGCGSCHTIPGVGWPQGKVGPSLDGLAERALIAGQLPNRPDILAAYIRNAPALVPGTGMPAMPLDDQQARDIAAYLYEQKAN